MFRAPGFSALKDGYRREMRIGRNMEVRPLGGGPGCLGMLVVSIVASVLLTVVLNLVLR